MKFENLLKQDFNDIVGQEVVKKQLKSALMSDRNLILVGAPGIGKTTLAKNIAKLMPSYEGKNAPFIRIQGSPDLTAEDLLGDIDPIKARVTLIQRAIKVTITLKYTEPGEIVENEINKYAYAAVCGVNIEDIP